jgi:site-specific recombinase XerD
MLTFRKPVEPMFDRRGYYRSPVTLAEYHRGKPAPNKGRRFPPEPLTPRECLALLDGCGRGAGGKRNAALIAVLWRAGLRVSEALALLPKDVDLERGEILVLHGKGNKSRLVGVDRMACDLISVWLEQRRELGATRGQPLFCVISKPTIGKPMHASYVRNLLKDLGAKAGIEKRCHPHGLRHTHASELADEGVDIRVISGQLGHANSSVTARYIDHVNPSRRIAEIRAREWPSHGAAA